MLKRVRARAPLTALISLLAVSCSDEIVGPQGGIEARFVATAIGDNLVPFVESVDDPQYGSCLRIHDGGHLILFASGKVDILLDSWKNVCGGVIRTSGAQTLGIGTYRLEGDHVVLQMSRQNITGELFRGEQTGENTGLSPRITFVWAGVQYVFHSREPVDW